MVLDAGSVLDGLISPHLPQSRHFFSFRRVIFFFPIVFLASLLLEKSGWRGIDFRPMVVLCFTWFIQLICCQEENVYCCTDRQVLGSDKSPLFSPLLST